MDRLDIEELEISPERPSLEYEPGSFTLSEILDTYLLPMIVQLDNQKHRLPFTEFNFDLSQPLLLYKKRNIQKVPATSVTIYGDQYVDIGESLLIPEDYKGWFAVLQRLTGNERADDNVPHFRTVEEVANSNTDKFLIGGSKLINGLLVFNRSEGQLNHQQKHFAPGDILIRDKVFFGDTRKRSRLFRKPKYITEKFLLCRDDADREILLPFEQKGIFYQVSERCGKPNHNVMQMSDIVARNIPPRIVKLVFGRFPVTPCSFTGLMKVDTARLESSIIAATIINTKNILIEIPLTANIHFKLVKLTDELKNNPCYKNAKDLCSERATTYMKNIKVCYNFSRKSDENLQMIKKESDMDLISSDEGAEDLLSSGEIKMQSKMSSSLKRRFRKTKSLERNNNTFGEKEKKSSLKRSGSKKSQSKQSPYNITNPLPNGSINDVNMRVLDGLHTRFSHEIESGSASHMRSGRSLSTGRMSFCFGNSYMSVPIFANQLSMLDENKDKSFENLNECGDESQGNIEVFPPPMPQTNIGFFVNTEDGNTKSMIEDNLQNRRASEIIYDENFGQYASTLQKDCVSDLIDNEKKEALDVSINECVNAIDKNLSTESQKNTGNTDEATTANEEDDTETDDYIPVTTQRRPSSKPPVFSPPPLPGHDSFPNSRDSTSTSSDAKTESVEKNRLSDLSPELIQYDVPKIQEPGYIHESQNAEECTLLKARRPSTFTFSEGLGTLSSNTGSMPLLSEIKQLNDNSPTSSLDRADLKFVKLRRPSTFTFTEGLSSFSNKDVTSMPLINEYGYTEEDSPIYENIRSLQELMLTMENLDNDDCKDDNNKTNEPKDDSFSNETHTENHDEALKPTASDNIMDHENEHEIAMGDKNTDNNSNAPFDDTLSGRETLEAFDSFSYCNQMFQQNDRKLRKTSSLESNSSKISKQSSLTEREKSISELTVDEFIAQLEQIGIKDNSLNTVKELGTDGKSLSGVAFDDESLKDCLPGVSLIDLQKISMFLRGWRPYEES